MEAYKPHTHTHTHARTHIQPPLSWPEGNFVGSSQQRGNDGRGSRPTELARQKMAPWRDSADAN